MSNDSFETSARNALARLGPEAPNWIPDRPGVDANVVIVGAGHTGLSLAFALRRAGIGKVVVLEKERPGEQSIWRTRARMLTLRTPKISLGPDLDLPELTFQAWFEARYGSQAFKALGRPATSDWADYLDWYQAFTQPDVRYETSLENVEPASGILRLALRTADGKASQLVTRKLVLATGFPGSGAPFIPESITANVPRTHYAHSLDIINFAALKGKSVAVVGVGASGFDQAAVALEAGATEVRLFGRRADIPTSGPFRAAAYPGGEFYPTLPDAVRWRLARFYLERGSAPPKDSIERVAGHPHFHLHLASGWDKVRFADGRIRTDIGEGSSYQFDFVVAATGFRIDPTLRPELGTIANDIALWRDRYVPPAAEADDRLGRFPYLGPAYQFTERTPGAAPQLRNIHAFNYSAFVSFARILGDIASLRGALPKLTDGIAGDFFADDVDAHIQRMSIAPPGELKKEDYERLLRRPAGTTTAERHDTNDLAAAAG